MVGGVNERSKLFIIVRSDLKPGSQAVQGMHAMRQFVAEHSDAEIEWFERSNRIAFLQIDDEPSLVMMMEKLLSNGFRVSSFNEPDLDYSLTAIAVDWRAEKKLTGLRLALDD